MYTYSNKYGKKCIPIPVYLNVILLQSLNFKCIRIPGEMVTTPNPPSGQVVPWCKENEETGKTTFHLDTIW